MRSHTRQVSSPPRTTAWETTTSAGILMSLSRSHGALLWIQTKKRRNARSLYVEAWIVTSKTSQRNLVWRLLKVLSVIAWSNCTEARQPQQTRQFHCWHRPRRNMEITIWRQQRRGASVTKEASH